MTVRADEDQQILEPLPRIGFRPMERADSSLVVDWLAEPDVARWWGTPLDADGVEAKYGPRIDGSGDATEMWIAEVDGEAAGMAQCYRHADFPVHDAVVGIPGAVGVDYLLGASHRGRGLAARLLHRFAVSTLDRHRAAPSCVATPARANEASWRALEGAGFRRSHACQPPDEPPAWAYVLERR